MLLTVRNSLQPSFIIQAAHHAGALAEAEEKEKDHHHEALVTATGSILHPFFKGKDYFSKETLQSVSLPKTPMNSFDQVMAL